MKRKKKNIRWTPKALSVYADASASEETPQYRWEGALAFEDQLTGDGRVLDAGSLRWAEDIDENPLKLRFVTSDVGAHDGAETIGGIDTLERRPGGVIWGSGPLYLTTPGQQLAFQQLKEGQQNGISLDLDDVSFVYRLATDPMDSEEGDDELEASAGDQASATEKTYEDVFEMESDDEVMVTLDARIRAATVVAIPAFADARIAVIESEDGDAEDPADTEGTEEEPKEEEKTEETGALIAGGYAVKPPAAFFANPGLTTPTSITVTEDGHVFGHLATWDTCHIGNPSGGGVCVTPPHSQMNYSRFHQGSVMLDDGSVISSGKLTMSTGHAGPKDSAAAATAHYDHTGTAIADVRVGEDAVGIWFSGALRPNTKPEQVRELRASPISGDWRKVDGSLELHAALAVNVPGFPIPRPQGLVASGEMFSLVSSGVVLDEHLAQNAEITSRELAHLTPEVVASLLQLAASAREQERIQKKATVEALANRRKVMNYLATR